MSWTEIVKQELVQARRELTAAEEGLKDGTPAAHGRYVRAFHEAELAEQRASRASQHAQRHTWH
ncbi:hypothetical protein [Hyalangium versicolor]|uniref:hypothetical protein n=1 Tax=Hyalangium versicolor TaxID=2861190 RepID=UPI001CCB6103|nr:hypothetical protein [Hyalangium versicolor]